MTNKTINLIGLLLLLCLFTACPYQSEVPISEPQTAVSKDLLGKWIKESNNTEEEFPEYFVIEKKSQYIYKIIKYSYDQEKSAYTETPHDAHISLVEGQEFLNMHLDPDVDMASGYGLYKLERDKESFVLFELSSNIDEKFEDSKELTKFIKKYMHLSFFYNSGEETYTKEK
ncbi:MAG: hypothetical protein MK212_05515 [Saprospiraceae bacterium]|nr:hypothetical protein [Saprospiraceae bacterium]